jgi:hypothetical protein
MLDRAMENAILGLGSDQGRARYEIALIQILTQYQGRFSTMRPRQFISGLTDMLPDTRVREFLGFNQFNQKWWFNKESMEMLVSALFVCSLLERLADGKLNEKAIKEALHVAYDTAVDLMKRIESSGYEASKLSEFLGE